MKKSPKINPVWSTRRPISYDTWLQVRDERNRLALQVEHQAARIRELQAVIQMQRKQLLSAGTRIALSTEINLMCWEAPHE